MRVPFCVVAVLLGAGCCRTEIMWAVRFRANETKFQGSYPALTFTQALRHHGSSDSPSNANVLLQSNSTPTSLDDIFSRNTTFLWYLTGEENGVSSLFPNPFTSYPEVHMVNYFTNEDLRYRTHLYSHSPIRVVRNHRRDFIISSRLWLTFTHMQRWRSGEGAAQTPDPAMCYWYVDTTSRLMKT